jgi:hypothetical protein
MNLYERLHLKAYKIDRRKASTTLRDSDIAEAYRLLIEMRNALALCERQFRHNGEGLKGQLGGHLSLVERQKLEGEIERNLGIADVLAQLIRTSPELPAQEWRDIKTAPQDGSHIRVLGRRDDGSVYQETTRWWNIRWAVELMHGYGKPTHWLPMEGLPEGYK